MSDAIPSPRAAATVLLLRDNPGGLNFSVFMVQRSMKSSFMPGAYVFPGGKVEKEDWQPEGVDELDLSPEDAVSRFGGELPAEEALAFLRAAVREVAEEALIDLPGLAGVQTFAHWITPAVESRRFDTWFLVVEATADAAPSHDDHEVVASRWVNPKEALERYGDGDMGLAPPTYLTLLDLARFESTADVMADAESRKTPPIQPVFDRSDGRITLYLPGDAGHPSQARLPVGPTRLRMQEDGQWWIVDGGSRQEP